MIQHEKHLQKLLLKHFNSLVREMQYKGNTILPLLHHAANAINGGGLKSKFGYVKSQAALGVIAGYPDLILHYKGKTVFFELKTQAKLTKTGKLSNRKLNLSDDQNIIHQQLRDNGFEVHIIVGELYPSLNIDAVKQFIEIVKSIINL